MKNNQNHRQNNSKNHPQNHLQNHLQNHRQNNSKNHPQNHRQNNPIFREKSLERLSSPERLDLLMNVVNRRDWLPLSTLGILIFLTILWSIFGKIPVNVTSKGVLILPGRIKNIQSPRQGQLKQLKVKPGDCIEKDEIIATIDPFEIRSQLQLQREKIAQLQTQQQTAENVQTQRTKLEINAIELEKITKKQQLSALKNLTPILQNQAIIAFEKKQISRQQQLKNAQNQSPILEERVKKRRILSEKGVISSDLVLEAEREYMENLQSISQLIADLQQLEIQKTEARQKYLENLNTISQLKAELQKLDTQIKIIEQQNLQASTERENQIQEIQLNIAKLQKQFDYDRQIKSPYSGCILELTASNSSVLNSGEILGSIQIKGTKQSLESLAYFPVGDGKKISPGMQIYITPNTVRRERFGGIVGTVTQVSPLPITKEGTISIVGNPEIVEELIAKVGPVIAVRAELERDSSTPSGYKWSSSRGPENLPITSGTTTIVRVTIEQQAPIALILPILREKSGIYLFSAINFSNI